MPTYDYECMACGHEEEIFQSMLDEPKKRCPKCKKMKFRRMIGTGAGLVFKGTGFYETDYKKKGGGSEDRSGKAKDSSSEGSSGKEKSGNKSAEKKPTKSGAAAE